MDALANELHQAYTRKIYSVLATNDPEYRRCLTNAGVAWSGQTAIPPEKRAAFEEEMRLQATFGAGRIRSARSLDPSTIRIQVLKGPSTLYRVADSKSEDPYGIWWFTERVASRCRHEAGPNPKARADWLRNALAVCYNWSSLDLIHRLDLYPGETLPAVEGVGLPMPHYKLKVFFHKETGQRVIEELPPDYWQKKGRMLFGGELQIVLPWIPIQRIATIPSL